MLCFVLFCAGAINLCQIFVQDIWQFAGIQFVYGLFLAGAVPNVNARLVEVTDPSMRGKAFGLVTSAQQFGGVIGPLLGGFGRLYAYTSYSGHYGNYFTAGRQLYVFYESEKDCGSLRNGLKLTL